MSESDTQVFDVEFFENKIWFQNEIPAIRRPLKGRIQIVVPEGKRGSYNLSFPNYRAPEWMGSHWELPPGRLDDIAYVLLREHSYLYLIQPYSIHSKCTARCRNATRLKCKCSCLGLHHGVNSDEQNWYETTESFLVNLESETLSVRLLTN